MRIVVSYEWLVLFGGTESYVLTISEGLQRLGHEVTIFTPRAGASAEFARERGMRVETQVEQLPGGCDAVLAQDSATAYELAGRLGDAARIFIAHSAGSVLQSPPQAEGACDAVVVMNDRLAARTEGLAHRLPVARLRQPIDLQRFCFQTLRLEQRRRARVLLLSNTTKGTRARMIERACAQAGLELRSVGATSNPTTAPEHEIADAEIVLTLGRGALEAMASGRAAYVFGDIGGDGWVTAASYTALESDGFSGRALGRTIDVDRLAADLADWREEMGEVGRDLACKHHGAEDHCLELIALIENVRDERAPGPDNAAELARLVRLEWSQCVDTRVAVDHANIARKEAAELETELAAQRASAEHAAAELERLRQSRRYRLGTALAAPLERLRARRRA